MFGWAKRGAINSRPGYGGKKKAHNCLSVILTTRGHCVPCVRLPLPPDLSSSSSRRDARVCVCVCVRRRPLTPSPPNPAPPPPIPNPVARVPVAGWGGSSCCGFRRILPRRN
uniref:Uncharacterized protein n=1 Tax=Leersia perrieri TaxID=77586 RepID=A0A0D9WB08_9ORYZ